MSFEILSGYVWSDVFLHEDCEKSLCEAGWRAGVTMILA